MTNFISFLDGGKTSQEGLYKFLSRTLGPGVPTAYNAASLAVSQRGAGANMSVDIAIGDAHIPYSTYSFWGFTDAVNNVTVSASDPSNPRRDIVVAYVDLSVVSSASNNNPGALKFKVIAGTPAGSPSDPSDTVIGLNVGAGNPWVKLARLSIAANATTVVNANITDLRTAVLPLIPDGGIATAKHADSSIATAKLADAAVTAPKLSTDAMYLGYAQITANVTTTSTTTVQVPGLSATVNVPTGGRKIKITAFATNIGNSTNSNGSGISIWDGVVGSGTQIGQSNKIPANNEFIFCQAIVSPGSGSRTYNVGFTSVTSGTTTIGASIGGPAFILVEVI